MYITGTVQGVFFRAFIKENAEKLDVRGFTRNLENGKVEVFAEGDADAVNKLVDLCKKGPRHSQIRNVEIKPEKFQGMRNFKVIRF